ncbi:helix-turn-helix domain-containing protein [Vitreoscilla stercoraria]|uniref:Helix-turn-helix domain-containing protein n=3 Tax=Vitreoscilla stercoraria TaxID=61 RepID=A0ABY4E7G1_VITST|nr:helix-turn-helix domain-containing protein [Vitreoscilla stercoraria]UOO91394.1 helix-turn-helix domain-containing protein [Vitreoscilla stercoraria]
MTDERKKRIWFLWKQGKPMAFIAKDIMKPPATVYSFLEYHGGIEPDIRRRKATDLTLQERECISRALAAGLSLRAISRQLNRSPSTISREVSRNGGAHKYRAYLAEQLALKKVKRPKSFILQSNSLLKQMVIDKLSCCWSPEQIAGWLKFIQFPHNPSMHVSYETIYKSLYLLKKKHSASKAKKTSSQKKNVSPRPQSSQLW